MWDPNTGQWGVPNGGGGMGPWIPLVAQNGWVVGDTTVPPAYRIEGNDVVRFKGNFNGTNAAYGVVCTYDRSAFPASGPYQLALDGLGYDITPDHYMAVALIFGTTVLGSTPVSCLSTTRLDGSSLAGAGGKPGMVYLDGVTYSLTEGS